MDILLNGLAWGLLLYLLAAGLTLVFSLLGVLNFAHAAFYMLGAYAGHELSRRLGWWPGLALAPLAVGLLGVAVERYGLRAASRHGHAAEMLFTFGLAWVIEELVQLAWGRAPLDYRPPAAFTDAWIAGFPAYRAFMMALALGVLAALWLAFQRTRLGLVVRAARGHPEMVQALGYDLPRVRMAVFGAGCALAGLAGATGGAAFVTEPSMGHSIGALLFVVIVLGGLGSLPGAFAASIAVGVAQTLAVASPAWSWAAPSVPYLLMIVVLLARPHGLAGSRYT